MGDLNSFGSLKGGLPSSFIENLWLGWELEKSDTFFCESESSPNPEIGKPLLVKVKSDLESKMDSFRLEVSSKIPRKEASVLDIISWKYD